MKIFTSFKHALLLCAMLFAWGGVNAQGFTEEFEFAKLGYTNAQKVTTVKGTNFTLTFDKADGGTAPAYYNTGTAVRMYENNTLTIAGNDADKYLITKVEITRGSSSTGSFSVDGKDVGDTWSSTAGASSVVFTKTGTKNIRVASVKITYVENASDKIKTTIAFFGADNYPYTEKEFTVGQTEGTSFNCDARANSANIAAEDIKYESSDNTIATVDAEGNVVVNTTKKGEAKITASFAGNDQYTSAANSITIKVASKSFANTQATAYTVSEILEYLANESAYDLTENVYVKGTISELGDWKDTFTSLDYQITDGTKTFKVYRGLPLNAETFSSNAQVSVGDEVVICGKVLNYADNNGNVTPEFDRNSQIVSQKYNRVVAAGDLGTICLPYGGTIEGANIYSIAGADFQTNENDRKFLGIRLTKEQKVEAGIPYIFEATAAKLTVTYEGTFNPQISGKNGLIGTFQEITMSQGQTNSIYGLYQNKLAPFGNNIVVGANRAYIDVDLIDEIGNGAKTLSVYGAEATGISIVDAAAKTQKVYDLQGREVKNPAKGLYIVNGKKVIF